MTSPINIRSSQQGYAKELQCHAYKEKYKIEEYITEGEMFHFEESDASRQQTTANNINELNKAEHNGKLINQTQNDPFTLLYREIKIKNKWNNSFEDECKILSIKATELHISKILGEVVTQGQKVKDALVERYEKNAPLPDPLKDIKLLSSPHHYLEELPSSITDFKLGSKDRDFLLELLRQEPEQKENIRPRANIFDSNEYVMFSPLSYIHPVSIDEAPIDEASIDEASIDEASIDEASIDEASIDEASIDEASIDEASSNQSFSSETSDSQLLQYDEYDSYESYFSERDSLNRRDFLLREFSKTV